MQVEGVRQVNSVWNNRDGILRYGELSRDARRICRVRVHERAEGKRREACRTGISSSKHLVPFRRGVNPVQPAHTREFERELTTGHVVREMLQQIHDVVSDHDVARCGGRPQAPLDEIDIAAERSGPVLQICLALHVQHRHA